MQLTKLSLMDISLLEGQLFGRWICRENHPFGSGIFFSANTLNQDILTGKISWGTLVNIENFLFLMFSHIANAPLNQKFVSAKPENSCHLFKRCNALFYGRIHFTGDMCSLDHCLNFWLVRWVVDACGCWLQKHSRRGHLTSKSRGHFVFPFIFKFSNLLRFQNQKP